MPVKQAFLKDLIGVTGFEPATSRKPVSFKMPIKQAFLKQENAGVHWVCTK